MASIAESFRSTCGSVRGAPECSTQTIPAATPHVGQGTETSCSGVSSFFFISEHYSKTCRKNCPIWNTASKKQPRDKFSLITFRVRLLVGPLVPQNAPENHRGSIGSLHGNKSSAFVPKQRP